jgi:hypothetical protein
MLPDADGSTSTPPADPSSGPLAAFTSASPTALATVGAIAAAVVVAAGAFAMDLVGSDDAGSSGKRPASTAPGPAEGLDAPGAPPGEPPTGQLPSPALGLPMAAANERANKRDPDEEENEEEDEDSSDSPPSPTPTPPPTYDARIGSVDKSDVSGQNQSLTLVVGLNSAGPRTGVVLDLAITIDSTDSTDWRFAVDDVAGSGWTCRAPNGDENLDIYVFDPGTTLTCSYEFSDHNSPPPLSWQLLLEDGDGQIDGVTGSVRVSVVGQDDPQPGNDTATF